MSLHLPQQDSRGTVVRPGVVAETRFTRTADGFSGTVTFRKTSPPKTRKASSKLDPLLIQAVAVARDANRALLLSKRVGADRSTQFYYRGLRDGSLLVARQIKRGKADA